MSEPNYIPIELEGTVYNLASDVAEVYWDGKEDEDDLKGFYDADLLFFQMKNGSLLAEYVEDLDSETRQYVYDFVDPV